MWFFFLGVGEVCGVILGEWRGEDLVDKDIFEEDVKTFFNGVKNWF